MKNKLKSTVCVWFCDATTFAFSLVSIALCLFNIFLCAKFLYWFYDPIEGGNFIEIYSYIGASRYYVAATLFMYLTAYLLHKWCGESYDPITQYTDVDSINLFSFLFVILSPATISLLVAMFIFLMFCIPIILVYFIYDMVRMHRMGRLMSSAP